MNGEPASCLIDTGAATSFISESYVRARKLRRESLTIRKKWVTANGAPLQVAGQVTADMKIGDKSLTYTFVVADGLIYDVILGNELLRAEKFVVDYESDVLRWQEQAIPIHSVSRSTRRFVNAIAELEIEPFTRLRHEIRIDDDLDRNKPVVVECFGSKTQVVEAVSTIKDDKISIFIENNTPSRQVIAKGTTLCKISPCEVLAGMKNAKEVEEYISGKTEYVNAIKHVQDTLKPEKKWEPFSKVKVKGNLNQSQSKAIDKLMSEFDSTFARNDEDIGSVKKKYGEHDIVLTDPTPIKQRPHRVPYAKERVVNECVDKMIKMDILEPSNSDWASPIVLVKKADGTDRFCVDYRKLNDATVKDSFPMPHVEGQLNKLHGCKYFTKFDLISGYWQIKMTDKAKRLSAFICHRGLYQFKVMPFGLCNAGATFQRIMELVVEGLTNTTVYIDDILIYSKTFEEHMKHIKAVLERLKEAGIKIKTSKCEVACQETTFLGYKVGEFGVSLMEDRVEKVRNYPKPTTIKQLRTFIGFANYYRHFIDRYADIIDPLNKMALNKASFVWTPKSEQAFEELKRKLTSSPILSFPDFSKEFILATDASDVGLGAVLSQIGEDGSEHPIFFASRALDKAERHYSTIERELLAIVWATDKFRYYLYGREFSLYTDHNPLIYLKNLSYQSRRLTKWRLKLSEYDMKIAYKKGETNGNADAMSRVYHKSEREYIGKDELIEAMMLVEQRYLDSLNLVGETDADSDDDYIDYVDEDFEKAEQKCKALCISKDLNSSSAKLAKRSEIAELIHEQNAVVGDCVTVHESDTSAVSVYMLTKEHGSDKSSLQALKEALTNLVKTCDAIGIEEVAFLKAQGGLDKLEWKEVKKLFHEILIKNKIKVYVYTKSTGVSSEKSSAEATVKDLERFTDINEKIRVEQAKDEYTRSLKERVERKELNGYIIEDGVLLKLRRGRYYQVFKQIVTPKSMRLDVLRLCHDDCTGAHLGEAKTLAKVLNRFCWPNAHTETKNYVKSCEVCEQLKPPPANRAELKPIENFEKPFDVLGIDILELSRTVSGNKYCLVLTDYLTKWAEAFPMKDMTADTVAKLTVFEVFCRHGAPTQLHSDQGKQFCSELVKSICNIWNVKKTQTTPYNPKCNGETERYNQTLCRMLAAYSDANQTNWDLFLPLVMFAYRTSEHAVTKTSSFALLYGREARIGNLDNFNSGYKTSEFVRNLQRSWKEAKCYIEKQAAINKDFYDSKYRCQPIVYKEGDLVRLHQPKTPTGLKTKLRRDKWSKAYKVTRVLSDQTVEIDLGGKTKIVCVNNIKKKGPERLLTDESTAVNSGQTSSKASPQIPSKTSQKVPPKTSPQRKESSSESTAKKDDDEPRDKHDEVIRNLPTVTRSGRVSRPVVGSR
jgi:hypothetical protein